MLTLLKQTLRSLQRNPLFASISLFGISFTVMFVILLVALLSSIFGKAGPLENRDRLVVFSRFTGKQVVADTVTTYDTVGVDGAGMVLLDSTVRVEQDTNSTRNSGISHLLYENNLKNLSTAEDETYVYTDNNKIVFHNGKKFSLNVTGTEANYTKLLPQDLLYGRYFNEQEVVGRQLVAVISDELSTDYFGEVSNAVIGQEITLYDDTYEVIGILKKPFKRFAGLNGDVFMPYTSTGPFKFPSRVPDEYLGGGTLIALAPSADEVNNVRSEVAAIASRLPILDPDDINVFFIHGLTFLEQTANEIVPQDTHNRAQAIDVLKPPVIILLLLVILLPAINFTSINLSRTYRRAAEIGVRRSFGATEGNIIRQFLVETLVITLLGGGIGIGLALLIMRQFNADEWMPGVQLAFTPGIAVLSVLFIFIFGLFTGMLPAQRLAKASVVSSLR